MKYTYLLIIFSYVLITACSSLPKAVKQASWLNNTNNSISKQWTHNIGESFADDASFTIKPVVTSNTILTLDRLGLLTAFHNKTGKQLWDLQLVEDQYSGIDATDNLIVVTSISGNIIALNQTETEGKIIWQQKMPASILSPAQIADKQIIIQLDNEQLIGISAKNAATLWNYYAGSTPLLTLRGTSVPHIEGSIIYTGFANGSLIAFDSNNSELLWQQNIIANNNHSSNQGTNKKISDIDGFFTVTGNYIFAHTYQGQLTAVNKTTGDILWRAPINSQYPPVISTNQVYLVDIHNNIYALEKNTGSTIWMQKALAKNVLSDDSNKVSTLITFFHYLAIGDAQGNLYLLSQQNGKFVQSLDLGDPITGNALLAEQDHLYIIDDDADLHAIKMN